MVQPAGSEGQQPGDGLGEGVTPHRVAEHPAGVLIKGGDVEPDSTRLALIRRHIPALQQACHVSVALPVKSATDNTVSQVQSQAAKKCRIRLDDWH